MLLNRVDDPTDIVILQEPPWSFIGTDRKNRNRIDSPPGMAGWVPILPVPARSPDDPQPPTIAYVRRHEDFAVELRTNIIEDPYIQWLDIHQTGKRDVTIINIYNVQEHGEQCILRRLQRLAPPFTNPTFITGDFNLHHPIWAPGLGDSDPLTTAVGDWFMENGWSLLNDKGRITHPARHGGEQPSVIDVTFANNTAAGSVVFQDWFVNPSLAGTSDHYGITFTIDQGAQEVENVAGIKYNLKDIDIQQFEATLTESLEKRFSTLEALLKNRTLSHSELDDCEHALTTSLQETLDKVAKPKSTNAQAKPWWDQDMEDARQDIAVTQRSEDSLQDGDDTLLDAARGKVKRLQNWFKKLAKYKVKAWAEEKIAETK
ncbi:hypothetical protein L218DRAFT_1003198, partial [Marasmius fiardii PR-910]